MKVHPLVRRLLSIAPLLSILTGALLLRLALAPNAGMEFDMGTNLGWGRSAVELGLARSYSEQVGGTMLPNYPPFSMMVFGAVGHIYKTFISPDFDMALPAYRILMKLPPILADVLMALLLFSVISRWRGRRSGLLAATVIAVHPAIFYESALWGQTDSIHTLFLTAAVAALASKRAGLAAALVTLAILTKMQAVALVPLFLAVYLRNPRWLLSGLIGSLAVLAAVLLPFVIGGALDDIWNVYTGSVGYYAIVSSSAYNFWWSLLADSAWGKNDADLLFGLLSYRTTGILIVGSIMTATLWTVRRRLRLQDPLCHSMVVLFLISSLFAFAFFLFLTEMHERYLFPFVALGLPIAFLSLKGAVLYGFISFLFFLNLLGFLPWTPVERALHQEFPSLDVLIASAQVFLFVLWMQMTLRFRQKAALATLPSGAVLHRRKQRKGWRETLNFALSHSPPSPPQTAPAWRASGQRAHRTSSG